MGYYPDINYQSCTVSSVTMKPYIYPSGINLKEELNNNSSNKENLSKKKGVNPMKVFLNIMWTVIFLFAMWTLLCFMFPKEEFSRDVSSFIREHSHPFNSVTQSISSSDGATQISYMGKNSTMSSNGVSVTTDEDGRLTVNGHQCYDDDFVNQQKQNAIKNVINQITSGMASGNVTTFSSDGKQYNIKVSEKE